LVRANRVYLRCFASSSRVSIGAAADWHKIHSDKFDAFHKQPSQQSPRLRSDKKYIFVLFDIILVPRKIRSYILGPRIEGKESWHAFFRSLDDPLLSQPPDWGYSWLHSPHHVPGVSPFRSPANHNPTSTSWADSNYAKSSCWPY
jgi:hypothetical protein